MAVQVINYATGPRRRETPFTVVHMTIWLLVVSVVFIYVGCFVLPKFDLIFRDFHTDLPVITEIVLAASRYCRNDFGWIALLLLPAMPISFDRLNGRHWAIDGVPQ
jgi:type II secretory pathway component PulF